MRPRGPDAHRQGRGGTGQREVLLRRLLLLLLVLVKLGVHVVVLGLILEVLPLLIAGSLWVVDEGGHLGGGTKWGDREAWLRVLCVGVCVGEQVPCACWHRLNIGGGRHLDALPCPLSLAWTRPRPRERDTAGQEKGNPMIQTSMPS